MRSHAPYPIAVPHLALAFLALLAWGPSEASAQTDTEAPIVSQVQLAPLPETEQFSQLVDFRVRPAGESLDAMIQALARSVGLSAITQGIPADAVVNYDFAEPKPFREVWDIVLTLNGLEYVLRGNNIVVVGPPSVLESLQPQQEQGVASVTQTYPVSADPTELQALLESQFPAGSGVTVSSFEALGVLSVRGTEAQQAQVEDILSQFDRTATAPVRRSYTLSHARAEELAEVLTATVTAPESEGNATLSTAQQATQNTAGAAIRQGVTDALTATPTQSSAQTTSAAVLAEGQFSIAADARSNRIVVTAPPNVQRDVAALIEELDQPERQVNVQVRIQEVTGTVSEQLGLNLTSAVGNFSTTLFSGEGGLNFIFDAQKAVTGFNLGAILDVFEEQGLSRRVDDSNLTVLNNGEATLQSGGTLYISIAGNGSVENIEREIPYGVQIELSPQIANNGEINLDVSGRVDTVLSDLTDSSLLNLSTRNLSSRITLKPGQAIALGGLLQNELTDTTRRVPGLSDIPVVGNLFTNKSTTENNTQLLIIVTANVLE